MNFHIILGIFIFLISTVNNIITIIVNIVINNVIAELHLSVQ
ncbi:MAG: hypothetical protein U9Q66_01415 [Patescibacteria group bacterium]|nr:hypothetical protein [Patescibacteria group bacterium]